MMRMMRAAILCGVMLGFLFGSNSPPSTDSNAIASEPFKRERKSSYSLLEQKNTSEIQAQSVLSTTLSLVGQYTTTLPVANLDVEGNIAYLSLGEGGLQMVDVSHPSSPVLVGEYNTPGTVWDLDIDDHFAYLADGGSFRILDVSDPVSPTLVSSVGQATGGSIFHKIYAADQLVFLGMNMEDANTSVYDVSDPKHPVLINQISPYFIRMQAVGNLAYRTYIWDITAGMEIWDITNPAQIKTISETYFFLAGAGDLAVSGSLAGFYLDAIPQAAVPSGLIFLDISDPSQPEFLYRYERKVTAVDAFGWIFVVGVQDQTTKTGRFQLLEVLGRNYARVLDSVDIPWKINRIQVRGDWVYAAVENGGLLIYRIDFPYQSYFPVTRR